MRSTAKKPSIRLADIAKETGYSLSTVSKALNGRTDISEEARQIINAALKRYKYPHKPSTGKNQKTIEIDSKISTVFGPLKCFAAQYAKPNCTT